MLLEECKSVYFWRGGCPHLVKLKGYIPCHMVIPLIGVCLSETIYICIYIYAHTGVCPSCTNMHKMSYKKMMLITVL